MLASVDIGVKSTIVCQKRSVQTLCFFFSSRRRHTRFDCDWSSDVCSSDLDLPAAGPPSGLAARLELLGNALRPTPHVPLAMEGIHLFAKLEYGNPVGSIKDRSAYWILKRAAERGEICDETTVIESSSGNFAAALAAFTHLVGLRFIPVIDPKISSTYESFLRRLCPKVVKVEDLDDAGGFLKTRLEMVKHLCATVPNPYWTNQY